MVLQQSFKTRFEENIYHLENIFGSVLWDSLFNWTLYVLFRLGSQVNCLWSLHHLHLRATIARLPTLPYITTTTSSHAVSPCKEATRKKKGTELKKKKIREEIQNRRKERKAKKCLGWKCGAYSYSKRQSWGTVDQLNLGLGSDNCLKGTTTKKVRTFQFFLQ